MEPTPSYFLVINDEQAGPFTEEQVLAKLADGEVTEQTLAWKEGMAEWAALSTLNLEKPRLKLRPAGSPQPAVTEPVATKPKPALASQTQPSRPAAAPAARTCSACKQTITDVYYQVDGNVTCATCKDAAEAALKGGSAMMGFLRASGVGFGAALISAGVWYGIARATGYEFSLIAIAVGLFVGFAVRWGSYNRGGWPYQILAIFLTYLAIAGSTIPYVIQGMNESDNEDEALIDTNAVKAALAALNSNDTENAGLTITAGTNAVASATAMPTAAGGNDDEDVPGIFRWIFVLGFAFIAPFFGGIMGIVILGIALYEAWKINTRATLEITGPLPVGGPAKAGAA